MAFGCFTYPGSQGAEQQTVGVNRSGNHRKKAFNQPLVNASFQAPSVPPQPSASQSWAGPSLCLGLGFIVASPFLQAAGALSTPLSGLSDMFRLLVTPTSLWLLLFYWPNLMMVPWARVLVPLGTSYLDWSPWALMTSFCSTYPVPGSLLGAGDIAWRRQSSSLPHEAHGVIEPSTWKINEQ